MAVDPRVVDYVRKELAAGYSVDQVKTALLKQGWFEHEISEALEVAKWEVKETSPSRVERAKLGFVFSLLGGLIFLIEGLSLYLRMDFLGPFLFKLDLSYGLPAFGAGILPAIEGMGLTADFFTMIFAAIIITGSLLIYKGRHAPGGIVAVVLAFAGLVLGMGYVIGSFLSFAGGFLGIVKK